MVRIDMSEYRRSTRSPGYRRPARLRRLRGRRPAHRGGSPQALLGRPLRRDREGASDVFNVLLQVLDDGRLTDGQGRTVDFKNTVIIMTSNIGSHILECAGASTTGVERCASGAGRVAPPFRPEFLNRVDEIVVFRSLTSPSSTKIVEIQLGGCGTAGRAALRLEVTEAAKIFLAGSGTRPTARGRSSAPSSASWRTRWRG